MNIAMVAPDCAPVAKAGRPPTYEGMRNGDVWGPQPRDHGLWVPWYGEAVHCTVWFGYVHCATGPSDFFGRQPCSW